MPYHLAILHQLSTTLGEITTPVVVGATRLVLSKKCQSGAFTALTTYDYSNNG